MRSSESMHGELKDTVATPQTFVLLEFHVVFFFVLFTVTSGCEKNKCNSYKLHLF